MSCQKLCFVSCVVSLFSGCGGPIPQPDDGGVAIGRDPCGVHAVALRGLWDVFSRGLDELAGRMNRAGLPAQARSGPDWPNILRELLNRDPNEPIVLIGHSYGADQAIMICEGLAAEGRGIALLVLIDPTNPEPIPANVDRCVQFYIPTPLGSSLPSIFAGSPSPPADGNEHTQFRNLLVSRETLGEDVATTDHFNIESNDLIHAIIIEEVQSLCAATASTP